MNLLVILGIVAIICLLNRGPGGQRRASRDVRHATRQRDDQIDRLQARVSVLEEVLLDRERRLRDDFRGLG